MLTDPSPLPAFPLATIMPTLELVRRHARERRHRMQHGAGFYDETVLRNYLASETSLTLLLEHVLAPLVAPQNTVVNVTEQLQLAVRLLATLTQNVTPPDQAVPQVSVAQGRRLLLPHQEAATLVQVTLAAIEIALLDEALFLVVSLPRQVAGEIIVEIEADTPGLAGESDEMGRHRQQLAECLAPMGGSLVVELRLESSLTTFRLPAPALALRDA